MELSAVSDGASREQAVRVKLHFEDASLLSAHQIQEGLLHSWLLVGAHLHSIADLASHIENTFGLHSSCPHGISLRMECFTLPPGQPVGLLKDKDVVSIHRKEYLVHASNQQDGHARSSSLDTFEKIALLCDKDKASEELKDRGEDADKLLVKDGDDKGLKLITLDSQEQRLTVEKKQRKSKRIKLIPEILEAVEYDEDLKNCKAKSREKKRKLEEKERHCNKEDKKKIVADSEDAGDISQDTKKRRIAVPNADCGKRATFKVQKKPATISEKEEHAMKESAVNEQMKWSKKIIPALESQLNEEWKHKEKSPQQSMDHEIVKKCSRSTLRKKAKREWKRANLELQKKETFKERDNLVKAEIAHTEQGFAIASNKQEDDGDAEEERLPRVVRPGHVRFQDSDEDDSASVDPLQSSLQPDFGWSHGMSKRKGQSWGKEKTKRGNEMSEAMVEMKRDDIQELNPETLPVIEGTPQNGSVIAYRILRLTSSCCPELSEYCVGRVLDVHSPSGQLKLACVPKYRIWRNNEQDPPDDGGVIETEISSLAEVRLVECSQVESIDHESIELLKNETERNVCIGADVEMDVSEKCNNESSLTKAEPQVEKSNSAPYEGWLEIADAIQRKRDELERQTEGKAVGVPDHGNNQALEYEHQAESKSLGGSALTRNEEIMNGVEIENKEIMNGVEIENEDQNTSATIATNANVKALAFGINGFAAGKSVDDKSAFRVRGWHKRAGGLGSTMALLRSQNTLQL